jgi:uncharacterized protein (DUF1684 family)
VIGQALDGSTSMIPAPTACLAPLVLVLLAMPTASSSSPSGGDLAAWKDWRTRREARLRDPEGWLALAGLHWLSEGENQLEGLPGVFVLRGRQVTLRAAAADGWVVDGAPATERALASDAAGRPDRLRLGARVAQVIERGDAVALRVWDTRSPALQAFRGIATFPYDPRWRIEARWEAYPSPREVEQPSAAGPPQKALAPGRAHFAVDGRALTLEPTAEDGALMFVFKDATAPRETYGAGRFLAAGAPVGDKVVLDFNRAYNPPCAFTPYATCPLPERNNVLPVRVEAGEKKYAGH